MERGDHTEVASLLVRRLQAYAPTVHTEGQFYQYDKRTGIYGAVERAQLSRVVQDFAGLLVTGEPPKQLRVNASDVKGAIQLAADQAFDLDFFDGARRGVAFSDCFVTVTGDGVEACPHSEEHRGRFAYPFAFVPDARPEALLKFFGQVFRDDPDRDDKEHLLQEYVGICLLGLATKFQRAIVLVGDGANGKSVTSSIIERVMPPGSVCAIPPQDVGQEYRRALLAGKLLNVVSELPEGDILDSESWKSVVAGDTTTGREIRKEPITFKPLAGHLYSANRLPGTTDHTHGFWRRLIVIRFNRIFAEREQDPNLADRIVELETPAIVSWALQGAHRVLANGSFSVPSSSTEAIDGWRKSADQVRAFVEERTQPLPEDASLKTGVPAAQLYDIYRDWARENGHRAMASNKFGERMRLLGIPSQSDGHVRRYPLRFRNVS